jgi:hypothetical protein
LSVTEPDKSRVRRAVEELLAQGFFSAAPSVDLHVGDPLPIFAESGRQHSWFVPLQSGAKLAGFAQLLPSLTVLRVTSFQHDARDCDDCPDLADWIDIDRIMARAAALARQGEELGQPVLSFDLDPSRPAWRVRARSASGAVRDLLVAGAAAYEAGGARGYG